MKRVRLIGGPDHGKLVTLQEGARTHRVFIHTPPPPYWRTEPLAPTPVDYQIVEYQQKTFSADGGPITVWVPTDYSEMEGARALRDFIDGTARTYA